MTESLGAPIDPFERGSPRPARGGEAVHAANP